MKTSKENILALHRGKSFGGLPGLVPSLFRLETQTRIATYDAVTYVGKCPKISIKKRNAATRFKC